MALLLKYEADTGTIVGVWDSNNLAVLEAQRVEEDPGYQYLLCALAIAASTVEQNYCVRDGAVVLRAVGEQRAESS